MHFTSLRSPQKVLLRIIAFTVLICFAATNITSAQPSIGIQVTGPERVSLAPEFANLEIPEEFGTVREIIPARSAQRKSPVILHIQDAHGSYEAQIHIKKIISHLVKKYGFSLILVEGAAQELQPDLFRFFKARSLNLKIADLLAQDGELTGAELYLLEALDQIKGIGVEDPESYADNLKTFRDLIGNQNEVQQFVKALRTRIEMLGSRKLNKELRDFLRSWQAWREEKTDLRGFLSIIKLTAEKRLEIDLENAKNQMNYPMLVRYFKAQQIESKINFEQAEVERKRLIEFLESKGVESSLIARLKAWDFQKGISDWKEELPRFFLERLYESAGNKGFKFDDYPSLVRLWASLIFQSELDPEKFFQEIDSASDRLFDSLTQKDGERELVALFKDSIILEKLFSLQLTREEYASLAETKVRYQPDLIWERLDQIEAGTYNTKQPPLLGNKRPNLRAASSWIEKAFYFYDVALRRENHLVANTERLIRERKSDRAILITGGFHSEGLKESFLKDHFSYIEISPRLTSLEGVDKIYRQSMLEQSTVQHLLRMISRPVRPLDELVNLQYRRERIRQRIQEVIGSDPEKWQEFRLHRHKTAQQYPQADLRDNKNSSKRRSIEAQGESSRSEVRSDARAEVREKSNKNTVATPFEEISFALAVLEDKIHTDDDRKRVEADLVRMRDASSKLFSLMVAFGLRGFVKHLSDQEFSQYWPGIVEIVLKSNGMGHWILEENLVKLRDELGPKNFAVAWPALFKVFTSDGDRQKKRAPVLTKFVIAMKNHIGLRSSAAAMEWVMFLLHREEPIEETAENLMLYWRRVFNIKKTTQQILERYRLLVQNDITPLPNLLASNLEIEALLSRLQQVRSGKFNIDDSIDIDLNYHLLKKEMNLQSTQPQHYTDYWYLVTQLRREKRKAFVHVALESRYEQTNDQANNLRQQFVERTLKDLADRYDSQLIKHKFEKSRLMRQSEVMKTSPAIVNVAIRSLPLSEDMFALLEAASYYPDINVFATYHDIEIDPSDQGRLARPRLMFHNGKPILIDVPSLVPIHYVVDFSDATIDYHSVGSPQPKSVRAGRLYR
ncbi:MAG: hypothetical protein HY351_00865 [Candidatus Omnitrophica bacterium]|nr:hypothetical protein [Candidatus Omnitrophota bacterium]